MPDKPRRRWFAFRLRTLLIAVAAVAVATLVLRPMTTFKQRYSRLQIGWTMPEVRASLGPPSAVHIYRSVTIWEYEAGGITYRVRFRASADGPNRVFDAVPWEGKRPAAIQDQDGRRNNAVIAH